MSVSVLSQLTPMSSDRSHSYPSSSFDHIPTVLSTDDSNNDNNRGLFGPGWTHQFKGDVNSGSNINDHYLAPYSTYFKQSPGSMGDVYTNFGQPVQSGQATPTYIPPSTPAETLPLMDSIPSSATYPGDVAVPRPSPVMIAGAEVNNPWLEGSNMCSPKDKFDSAKVDAINDPSYVLLSLNPRDTPEVQRPKEYPSGQKQQQHQHHPPTLPTQPEDRTRTSVSRNSKRNFENGPEVQTDESGSPSKRPKRSPSRQLASLLSSTAVLSVEDALLLRLRDVELLSWKMIAAQFKAELGRTYQVPALQMRLKRLRERLRPWVEVDVTALRLAHDYWEKNRWEIIAEKMQVFGALEKWTPQLCHRKWSMLMSENSEKASSDPIIRDKSPSQAPPVESLEL